MMLLRVATQILQPVKMFFLRIKAKSRQFKLKKNLDKLFSKMYPKRMTKGSSQNRKEMIKD